MIQEITLQNFKCFTEQSFKLNQMTVLAGANATGKSSVIQSILLQEEAYLRRNEQKIDCVSMMGTPVGNLKGFISHNRKDIDSGDMRISITHDRYCEDIIYTHKKEDTISLEIEYHSSDGIKKEKVIYLQAERVGGRVTYPTIGADKFLPDGSNAPFIISNAVNHGRKVHEVLAIEGNEATIEKQFEGWIGAILGDTKVSLDPDIDKATIDIKYMNAVADDWVYPTMTGFGISYVESIIAAGLWSSKEENAILIIENPEAHLHPAAQSMMGRFLFLVALSGVQVITETHSEHMIDGIRLQAAGMKKTELVNALFFKVGKGTREIETEKINIRPTGDLDKWPVGFFDQKTKDLGELFNMRRGK